MSSVLLPSSLDERGRLIGKLNEDRFLRIMTQARPFPGWYYGIRRATEEQDRHGIDFVVELDVMEVPLQIKSSLLGREQHKEEHHRHCTLGGFTVNAVIVCIGLSDAQIKHQAFQTLDMSRDRFFRNGGRFERETRR